MKDINVQHTVTDTIALDGSIHSINAQELVSDMKSMILRAEAKIKKDVEIINIKYSYNTFVVDPLKLYIYDETDTESYQHFVHYFLHNFYGTSEFCNHTYNGGNIYTDKYNPLVNYHGRLLTNELNTCYEQHIRDRIILHMNCGIFCDWHTRFQMIHNKIDTISLLDFICQSDMFDLYKKPILSDRAMNSYSNYKISKSNMNIKHFGLSLIDFCIEKEDIYALKYLLTKYLDIYKLEKVLLDSGETGIFYLILARLWLGNDGIYTDRYHTNIYEYHKMYKSCFIDPMIYLFGYEHSYNSVLKYKKPIEQTTINDNIKIFVENKLEQKKYGVDVYFNQPLDIAIEHMSWLKHIKNINCF